MRRLALVLLLTSAGASAQTADTALETMVVSATSEDGTLRTTPHGVTVITREQIDNANAEDLGSLLGEAANVQLRSFFGGDKRASVDIRGMGDTAVSNVLVLVDGMRLNEVDLSGADLSTVALSSIERIEIIRGGGAVRYGDGAVGGVINIITRPVGAQGVRGRLGVRAGSEQRRSGNASVSARHGDWAVNADWRDDSTHGYRDNGDFRSRDRALGLHYVPAALEALELGLHVAEHRDDYGLPGPVSRSAFVSGREAALRATQSPHDRGSTEDDLLRLSGQLDLASAGLLQVSWRERERNNPYVIGYTPLLDMDAQRSHIHSKQHELNWRYTVDLGAHALSLGGQRLRARYLRAENGEERVGASTRRTGALSRRAFFSELVLRLPGDLALTAGWRSGRTRSAQQDSRFDEQCRYIYIPFPVPVDCSRAYTATATREARWRNRAHELGLSWRATSTLTLYASHTRHYRSPNVDELLLAADDLRPQAGVTDELGLRLNPSRALSLSVSAFVMRNRDEIYYGRDPATGLSVNRNYEHPTRRTGMELELVWEPSARWRFALNGGYVRPRFEGMAADIPLVARKTASVSSTWAPDAHWRSTLTVHHVGRRFDGNDIDNTQYSMLPAYNVADLSVRYAWGRMSLTATVFNLFDTLYSTQAYSETYYPMPDRHAQVLWETRF